MPGVGTGEPIAFLCAAYRAVPWTYRRNDYTGSWRNGHEVELTGRTRPYRRRGQGQRTTTTSREYRCRCGHVGWSAHVDLEALEGLTNHG